MKKSNIKDSKLSPIGSRFCGLSFQNKHLVITVLVIVLNIMILYQFTGYNFICNAYKDTKFKKLRRVISPPSLNKKYLSMLNTLGNSKEILAEKLSDIVQNQIQLIQSPSDCTKPNFICGHYDNCGFGCQLQHRVACLMMSYAMNLPLVHNEEDGWPFSQKWSDFFEPLGANCTPGSNTFTWDWNGRVLYRGTPCHFQSATSDQIEYPLSQGIPVSEELGDIVEHFHPNPFLWWVGQFMKYAVRLKNDTAIRISLDKKSIGFKHPIVGIHVRRTDKVRYAPEAYHDIDEYVQIVQSFFTNITLTGNYTGPKRVFVASDDSQVLPEAQEKYLQEEWEIIGFRSIKTLWKARDRVNALYEIVRDLSILADCDYIVCGFESNICRILWPLLNGKYLNGSEKLTSLDYEYFYVLQGHSIRPPRIFKVNSFNTAETIELVDY